MQNKAFIAGITGPTLNQEEIAFFKEQRPWGFILFARNIESPAQVRALTFALAECVGRENVPVLIDQEGGRVQRFQPPMWPDYPAARVFGDLYQRDQQMGSRAAWLVARLIAQDLYAMGVNVNCLPVLDVPVPGAHDVIGHRAYCLDPEIVGILGGLAAAGSMAGGVAPVAKHMPGHGRSTCDTHFELPKVEATLDELKKTDFAPFKSLATITMAMTAHVIYSAVDKDHPATSSSKVVYEIIRKYIGFDGLLISDDVSMNALPGDYRSRTRSIFAAGCDLVLHCNGDMAEMAVVAENTPVLSGKALQRADLANQSIGQVEAEDMGELRLEFAAIIAG